MMPIRAGKMPWNVGRTWSLLGDDSLVALNLLAEFSLFLILADPVLLKGDSDFADKTVSGVSL